MFRTWLEGSDTNNNMKLFLEPVSNIGNIGIVPQYYIDRASWLWHPDVAVDQPALLRFHKKFESDGTPLRLHISADQHYELCIDGRRISRGPDKSDVDHWSFSSYELSLDTGEHIIDVFACWIGRHAPMAIMSWRGGFILAAEELYHKQLTTGVTEWNVSWTQGFKFGSTLKDVYHVIGSSQIINGNESFTTTDNFKKAIVVRGPVPGNNEGISVPGWKLFPSTLPDQIDRFVTCGKIRAITDKRFTEDAFFNQSNCEHDMIPEWQLLISGEKELIIPPRTEISILWDLENYYCAYPELEVSRGKGSIIFWKWAESLYEKENVSSKGSRNEIVGKVFKGFGDQFIPDGQDCRVFRTIW